MERVWKRFTSALPGLEGMSYNERLNKLVLFSLERRGLGPAEDADLNARLLRALDPMLAALEAQGLPGALRHEIRFPPVRAGHRMVGSGLFVVNAPWGLEVELDRVAQLFGG